MPLSVGARLGPYEVVSALGAGGMGEVYRARDTKLERLVAIKILPDSFAHDPERLARFEREAKTLAALNHPNIGGIHGLEEADGVTALVLELVEGPTLADRIAQGRLPVDEALSIARQIGEALEAAHERGIVHRDLKPANIKLRHDGTVKVLDFGLAKALEPSGVSSSASLSPTITTPAMTQAGIILGTAAYMSPEQAKGRAADKRSDVWAFGCVLYEMLTGRRAFEGDEASDVLASVLAREPEWRLLPREVPPVIGAVLKRCLHKDRKQRIRDIGDVVLALAGAFDTAAEAAQRPDVPRPRWRRAIPIAAALVLGGVLVGIIALSLSSSEALRPVSRFDHDVPSDHTFRSTGRTVLALAPDGRHFVYNTERGLYLRSMGALEAQLIPGTETRPGHADLQVPAGPFFAPGGESVGYFEGGELKRIDVSGGAPFVICAAEPSFGASWETDNTILFGQSGRFGSVRAGPDRAGIMRVSANGGMPQLVVSANEGEFLYGPQLLPGGDAVLFTATTAIGGNRWDAAQVVVQSLSSGKRTVLLQGSDARYVATGHLLYAVDDALFAVPFDPARLALLGGPVSVANGLVRAADQARQTPAANYGISDNGTLVYLTGGVFQGPSPFGTLVWVDRRGREEPLGAPRRRYSAPRLSPDGTRVAFEARDPQSDLWIWEIRRRQLTQVTSDAGSDLLPVWSPDGQRLVWGSDRGGGLTNLYTQPADGTAGLERLTDSATSQRPSSFTPDGTRLVFAAADPTLGAVGTSAVLAMLSMRGDRHVTVLAAIAGINAEPSPDGRWVAYEAREAGQGGQAQVYVRPFGAISERQWQVSTNGGREPLWAPSGRELFYLAPDGALMAVPIEAGTGDASFAAGIPARVVAPGGYYTETAFHRGRSYDVSADGARFLRIKIDERGAEENTGTRRFVIVHNWFEELKRLQRRD
jgi:eukaryotic-like serine/threonine-protein kinase